MDITYLGHSAFKLKNSNATVVTDPYASSVGFTMPKVSADIVTVSHDHEDHNNVKAVSGTTRREKPFIITAPGEYEVSGVSVFGVSSFHDDVMGEKRGRNTIYTIVMDGLHIVHLGDLGHTLTETQITELELADILLCPVGGFYTIDPKLVNDIITAVEPSILIPMHYKTDKHNPKTFENLITVDEFLKDFGSEHTSTDKFSVTKANLPEEMEVVVLT